jgi:hypothetical protein
MSRIDPVRFPLFLPLFLVILGPGSAPGAEISYVKDVRPFLNKYCVECHKHDKAHSGVKLDSYKAMIQGNDPVVRPRQPDRSDLVKVLKESAGRKIMPPRKATMRPTAEEIAMIRAWVQAGAIDDTDAGNEARLAPVGEVLVEGTIVPVKGMTLVARKEAGCHARAWHPFAWTSPKPSALPRVDSAYSGFPWRWSPLITSLPTW